MAAPVAGPQPWLRTPESRDEPENATVRPLSYLERSIVDVGSRSPAWRALTCGRSATLTPPFGPSTRRRGRGCEPGPMRAPQRSSTRKRINSVTIITHRGAPGGSPRRNDRRRGGRPAPYGAAPLALKPPREAAQYSRREMAVLLPAWIGTRVTGGAIGLTSMPSGSPRTDCCLDSRWSSWQGRHHRAWPVDGPIQWRAVQW